MSINSKKAKNLVSRALASISSNYSSFLLTTNYSLVNDCATWRNYQPGVFKNVPYAKEYQDLVDNRQFSFLLKDGSFFQFYYEWEGNKLTKAKLAFYPVPAVIPDSLDELLEAADKSGLDMLEELYADALGWSTRGVEIVNTSSVRIDFDSQVSSHSKCHMQISSINEFRIEVEYLFDPYVFFEWIQLHFGSEQFKNLRMNKSLLNESKYHSKNCLRVGGTTKFPLLTIPKSTFLFF